MKQRIILDISLNAIASAVHIVILQLIILPRIALHTSDVYYGQLVAMISVFNLTVACFGNALNNVRLINEKDSISGYNKVLISINVINIILAIFFSIYFDNSISYKNVMFNCIVAVLWCLKEYYVVAFRININYIYMLINNVLMSIGYVLGYIIFLYTNIWQFVYVIGFILSILFIFLVSNIYVDDNKNRDARKIYKQTGELSTSMLLGRITVYADKMIVYPALGASNTSVLYIATLIGKLSTLIMSPISSVVLSYVAKIKERNKHTFVKVIQLGSVICFVGYVICILGSKPLLELIYPEYVNDVMLYIPIASASAIIMALTGIINPFVLCYINMRWQVYINIIYVAIYIFLIIILIEKYALLGVCIATLITELCKLVFEIVLFFIKSK